MFGSKAAKHPKRACADFGGTVYFDQNWGGQGGVSHHVIHGVKRICTFSMWGVKAIIIFGNIF